MLLHIYVMFASVFIELHFAWTFAHIWRWVLFTSIDFASLKHDFESVQSVKTKYHQEEFKVNLMSEVVQIQKYSHVRSSDKMFWNLPHRSMLHVVWWSSLNVLLKWFPIMKDRLWAGTYFNCIMFMVASSVVTTILVLNYHHRQQDTHEMPEWVRFQLHFVH